METVVTKYRRLARQWAKLKGVPLANSGGNALGVWRNDKHGSTHLVDWPVVYADLDAARRIGKAEKYGRKHDR